MISGKELWKKLSPRERQVHELVCQGLTNKEIGNRLFICDKTSRFHMTHILAKAGVSSRSMLVAMENRNTLTNEEIRKLKWFVKYLEADSKISKAMEA